MISKDQQITILNIIAPLRPRRVGIFGSHARKEATAKSDMDILVQFEERYSLFDLIEMEEQLSDALRCKIDLVTERSVHPALKKYIEKDLQLFA